MALTITTEDGRTLVIGGLRTGPQGPPGESGAGDVSSVFGRTGAVTAQSGDYSVDQITDAVATDDPRLTDARTPTAHAASHRGDGSDPLTSTRSETGTSFSVDGDDAGATIYATGATTVSVTVDQAAADDACIIVQAGAGQVQLSAGSGVTLRYASAFLPRSAEQWSPISLHWRSATEVLVSGDLAEA